MDEGCEPESTPGNESTARLRPLPPFGLVVGLACGLFALVVALPPLLDGDLYWHLIAGAELAEGVSPRALGQDWSFAPVLSPWTSTQWLAEWGFFALHSAWSWPALAFFRVLTAAVATIVLVRTTLQERCTALAAPPFLVAVGTLAAVVSQERPQQFTFIGAAVLSGVLVPGFRSGKLPRWWVVAPLTVLWANLHGGWVLVPLILGLVALGRASRQWSTRSSCTSLCSPCSGRNWSWSPYSVRIGWRHRDHSFHARNGGPR